jgi:signal transduction histidine kinase
MRRETDFVLEQAAWPAMLLEENGGICRANQAARRVFGLPGQRRAATLASIWDDAAEAAPETFLRNQSAAGTAPLKLRVSGGAMAPFVAHLTRVMRDGHTYQVLQHFKESGASFPELLAAPAPTAIQPDAGDSTLLSLAQANWPALVVDSRGAVISANPAASRLLGAKAAAEGAVLTTLCAAEDAAALEKVLSAPMQASVPVLRLRLALGHTAPFRVCACPSGESKRTLLQFFRAEAKGDPAPAAAPARGEEEFLLQNAEWPALLVHRHGKVLRANRAAVRAFGSAIEKQEGNLGLIWSPQNADSAQQFLNLPPPAEPVPLHYLLKSGLPGVYLTDLCVTGNEEVLLLQLVTELAAEPRPTAPPKAAPSKTAPASAAATPAPPAAADPSAAYKQKLDCALQLARSVALDFNNALTSILGHTSLLLSRVESGHPWRSSLTEIEKSAAKAAETANDLAAFSRQEKDVHVQVAGNLNTLLERTVAAFESSLEKPIAITRQFERKLFTASFDEAKMQQALFKILENAVESISAEGRINVQTINLEVAEPMQDRTAKLTAGNYVCVEVSDTGQGIAAEVMPRIFEPFFTTKGSRHRGLGLAWVYGIVTNHGGGVAVSSHPGSGTTVRLYLPASRRIVREAPSAPADLTGNQTVLLVDDEDLVLTMGKMVLSAFGYTVMTANSGQKALEMFSKSESKVDLVITDLVMPNMSGRELTEHIERLAPGTRVLWSSGYLRSSDSREQERYLQKPFTSQDLLRKVKEVLSDRGETSVPGA